MAQFALEECRLSRSFARGPREAGRGPSARPNWSKLPTAWNSCLPGAADITWNDCLQFYLKGQTAHWMQQKEWIFSPRPLCWRTYHWGARHCQTQVESWSKPLKAQRWSWSCPQPKVSMNIFLSIIVWLERRCFYLRHKSPEKGFPLIRPRYAVVLVMLDRALWNNDMIFI